MSSKKPPTKTRKKKVKKNKRKLTPRLKYEKGGRIEAYTMGEALGKKRWP